MNRDWTPDNTWPRSGPPQIGALVAVNHAVWRIATVTDLPLNDSERETWIDWGMPNPWSERPYTVDIEWVAGAIPADWENPDRPYVGEMTIRTSHRWRWRTYPTSGRWPMCSCCGEPTPCRAELEDREVTRSLKQVEKFARKRPDDCWSCNEPISGRQKTVVYVGDNLDLPGAPPPRFHVRGKCGGWAQAYEWRWIAVDPRRERILTWPKCDGILVVHGDGSSECVSGRSVMGVDVEPQSDCRGHLTHDHGSQRSCYVGDAYLAPLADMPGCPHGCDRTTHPGTGATRLKPRPHRRQPTLTEA